MSNDPMVTESGRKNAPVPAEVTHKATGMPALVHSGWDSIILGLDGKYILCPRPVGGGMCHLEGQPLYLQPPNSWVAGPNKRWSLDTAKMS